MRRITLLAPLHASAAASLLLLWGCQSETAQSGDSDTTASDGINTISASMTDASETTANETADTTMGSSGMPSCDNTILDQDETDVDCGGSCDPCADGAGCMVGADCQSLVCSSGSCEPPTCYDDVQNGNEDGIDCGTTCPDACGQSGECEDDDDCRPGEYCARGATCEPAACDNGVQETNETDIDCGGVDCPDCPPGGTCNVNADCASHICDDETNTCTAPSCSDGELNGDETDEDCGGSCPPCQNSETCENDSDCVSGICVDDNCEAPGCNDGVQNGAETDVDCGGNSCGPCGDGAGCEAGDDCDNGVCTDNMCAAPACDDGVRNGDESDTDCGGPCGATCTTGQDCFDAVDCVQGVCEFGQCSPPDCLDNVENGDETDLDCGGSCGATCEIGEDCIDGGDCEEGVCEMSTCQMPDCMDGLENGDETDVDCGASCGATCDTGDQCIDDDDCISGVCTANTCQAPSCIDDVQNGDEAGVDCEGSCPDPCDLEGEVQCNTFDDDSQLAPSIAAAPDGSFFVVVWTSVPINNPAQDGSSAGIYGQIFGADGAPVGGEFLVNTTTNGAQTNAAVAAWNNGFVVTWESSDTDGSGVYAKRYDSAGVVTTAQFQVNAADVGIQRRPDVAADGNGAFVICYEDRPNMLFDVLCRRYDNNAAALGVLTANSTVAGDQQLPSVARATNGNFVVAWQSANDQDGSEIGVYFRRFDSAGAQLTAETLVNQTTAGNQSQPFVGMNGGGEFTIAWTSDNVDGDSTAVMARSYGNNAAATTNEYRVNTYTAGAQNNPSVALNADGDALVAWVSANQDGNLTGIFAQRYDQAAAVVETEFRVNVVTALFQEEPDVVMRAADEPIIVYSSGPAADREVFFRRFDANFP
jgi:hypothetical protein